MAFGVNSDKKPLRQLEKLLKQKRNLRPIVFKPVQRSHSREKTWARVAGSDLLGRGSGEEIGWRGRSGCSTSRSGSRGSQGRRRTRAAGRGERLRAVPARVRARQAAGRPQQRRTPFDQVLMFKVVILQSQKDLSDERTEFYLRAG